MGKGEILPGIPNHHVDSCGTPPKIDLSKPHTHFENEEGEQGVMEFDPDTGVCRLWMGDIGWANEMRVEYFRGRIIVRYHDYQGSEYWGDKGLTKEERRKEKLGFLDRSDEEREKRRAEIDAQMRRAYEQIFGKLTDEEFERISDAPLICRDSERGPINQFFEDQSEARFRRLKLEKKEREHQDREADLRYKEQKRVERAREAEERRKVNEALQLEEKRLKESQRNLKKEQREEIEALREQIKKTKRLINGEPVDD